jgi:hypothetical protein
VAAPHSFELHFEAGAAATCANIRDNGTRIQSFFWRSALGLSEVARVRDGSAMRREQAQATKLRIGWLMSDG